MGLSRRRLLRGRSQLIEVGQVSLRGKGSTSPLKVAGENKRDSRMGAMLRIALGTEKRVSKFRVERGRAGMRVTDIVEGTRGVRRGAERSKAEQGGGAKNRIATAKSRTGRDSCPKGATARAASGKEDPAVMVGQLGVQQSGSHGIKAPDQTGIESRVSARLTLCKGRKRRVVWGGVCLRERLRSRAESKNLCRRRVLDPRSAGVDLRRVGGPGR